MNIMNDIGLITVFLLILLSVFLLTARAKNKRPNIYFAGFLIVTSLDISALFLGEIYRNNVSLNYLRVASVLLQMPLFYFYVKAVCYHNFRFDAKQILHAIPFFCFLILFFITNLSGQSYVWYKIISQVQYYVYIFGVFYELRKYKQLHLENYSFQSEMYMWLMTTSVLFLIGNTFVLIRTIFEKLYDYKGFPLLNLGISLFGLVVICWFVIKTMRTPGLFTGVDQHIRPPEKDSEEIKVKYKEEVDSLRNFMINEKPYLEEDLTLQKLAEKTEIPEKHLSFLINKIIGKHFFDFINSYRIQQAQILLQNKELNIQQIMYEVGFNSKSSFNTAFKKYTATTPSKYRMLNS
ncbi:AraC family transcriptional regulator [Ascidiimonas aurantiaca]|uniref:helix-turn-helix domain-containing protein n=1 Tax=Ascidiimonas aurantiaca TaxID=1685432 RepID=UPI0030EE4076